MKINDIVNTELGKGVVVKFGQTAEYGPDGWIQLVVFINLLDTQEERVFWECEVW